MEKILDSVQLSVVFVLVVLLRSLFCLFEAPVSSLLSLRSLESFLILVLFTPIFPN